MLDSPDCSPIRSKRPSSFSACSRTSSGMPASSILRPVLVGDRGVVLAELLADRLHLLAQEVLPLLLLGARLHVVADALAHLQLGQPLALEGQRLLEPLTHVDGLEQLDLLVEADLRRVAGGVRQRARLGDRADEGRDPAIVAAQLEDLLDHGAVLALELADALVGARRRDGGSLPRGGRRWGRLWPRPPRRGEGPGEPPPGRRPAAGPSPRPRPRCPRARTRRRRAGRAARAPRHRRPRRASRSCGGRRPNRLQAPKEEFPRLPSP